eukprot:TRINITY_DN58430_c0_g1_i1.p1 TRINITY_DN58430_c0_g1~~TRINITY_DN58430_c0_g1_i1.p1  ORF type:complete len:235 (-),score=24.20 TRINITY_DN58430_c0_g1_i1:43-663(-)
MQYYLYDDMPRLTSMKPDFEMNKDQGTHIAHLSFEFAWFIVELTTCLRRQCSKILFGGNDEELRERVKSVLWNSVRPDMNAISTDKLDMRLNRPSDTELVRIEPNQVRIDLGEDTVDGHSLVGFWLGTYGPHGIELLQCKCDYDTGDLKFVKILGDKHVPSREVSIQFSPYNLYPHSNAQQQWQMLQGISLSTQRQGESLLDSTFS